MNIYFVTFRSVTPAQRALGVLEGEGLRAALARTPRWMEERGCGYHLRLRCDDAAPYVRLLRQRGVEFRKVYRRLHDGSVEEVAL